MTQNIDSTLIDQFIKAAERAEATVECIPANTNALYSALECATQDEEHVLLSEPVDLAPHLFEKFKNNKKVIITPTEDDLASVKVGITESFGGVARTGSVCVSVNKTMSSPVSLFTREHIVVLDARSIVHRPREVFSNEFLEGKGLKRSFTFITGPSATADMGSLVRGVHGPGKLHIIILK